MQILEFINLINTFSSKISTKNLILPSEDHTNKNSKSQLLSQKNALTLPAELITYIDNICPEKTVNFTGVGHPISVLSYDALSEESPGYNVDVSTGKPLKNWQNSWFLIATDGGDPIIIDLNDRYEVSPVYSAMQGEENWDFVPIADSIGQFLLCAAAIEHALNFPAIIAPLDEDFNLAPAPAHWLFPLLKTYAGDHYDEWAGVFENYLA